MNVREALDDIRGERICVDDHKGWNNHCHSCTAHMAQCELIERLAPKVEAALRAAYEKGLGDGIDSRFISTQVSRGVTAGVKELADG